MKVAIASGKGGTGKTTLSVNLASLMAEKNRVVLVDLDVEEPNSGLFVTGEHIFDEHKFKMIPEWRLNACTLCGTCQEVCNFNAVIQLGMQIMVFPELCHSCHACSELCPSSSLPMVTKKMGVLRHYQNDNLTFIEGRLDVGQEQAVPLISQINIYIHQKFTENAFKLYDSPPGTSCPVIEATRDADFVILVTEPTPFGLHDLKLAVGTMRELNRKFGVVINRDGIGNSEVHDYCLDEKIPILARIPNDRRIAELYSRGELIYTEILEFKMQLINIEAYIRELNTGASK